MKLYCFSGLGADKRVFKFLKLDYPVINIDWIERYIDESIENNNNEFYSLISKGHQRAIEDSGH